MLPDPVHVNQFTTGGARGRYLCTAAAGAMALDAYTQGRIRVGAKAIDDRQDDKDGGIGLDDVATAWKRGWGLTFSHGRRSWTTVRARLARGDGLVLQGSYAVVPTAYRAQKNFTGGHAVYVSRLVPGGIRTFDTIAPGPTVWPESVVRNFYLSGLAAAGWGSGTAPGSVQAINASQDTLGGWGNLINFPVGHIITAADIDTIMGTLQRAGWFSGENPVAQVAAEIAYRGVLERVALGRPWNKALQDQLAAAAGTAAGDPFGLNGVAQALGSIPQAFGEVIGTIAWNGLWLVGILVIVILGLWLLVRSS